MKNFVFYLTAAVAVAAAARCGYFTVTGCGETTGTGSSVCIFLVSLAICWYLSLQMHEYGHKLFGVFVGMDVKINPKKFFSSSLGCEIAPRYAGNIKPRYIAVSLGGLVVNFLLVVLGAVFMALPCNIFGDNLVAVGIVIRCFLPTSLYVFLVNAAPFEYASGKTDGCAVLEAVRGEDSYKVAEAILTVQGMVNSGIALKDVDERMLLDVPQIREDDVNFVILTNLRSEYYSARGDEKKAALYRARYEQIKEYLH